MKVSTTVTDHAWTDGVDGLRRIVSIADEGGLDTIWVPDHLFQADPTSHPQAELFEAVSMLGFLAAITSRARLGMLVSPVPFRPPAVQVKAIATLEMSSKRRLAILWNALSGATGVGIRIDLISSPGCFKV